MGRCPSGSRGFWIVCGKGIVAGDFFVGVVIAKPVVVHNDRQRRAYYLAIYAYAYLTFRKNLQQFLDMTFPPVRTPFLIRLQHAVFQIQVVIHVQVSHLNFHRTLHKLMLI